MEMPPPRNREFASKCKAGGAGMPSAAHPSGCAKAAGSCVGAMRRFSSTRTAPRHILHMAFVYFGQRVLASRHPDKAVAESPLAARRMTVQGGSRTAPTDGRLVWGRHAVVTNPRARSRTVIPRPTPNSTLKIQNSTLLLRSDFPLLTRLKSGRTMSPLGGDPARPMLFSRCEGRHERRTCKSELGASQSAPKAVYQFHS